MNSSNPDLITAAANILREYVKSSRERQSQMNVFMEKFEELWTIMRDLTDASNGISKNRYMISELRTTLNKQIDRIVESIFQTETSMSIQFERIKTTMRSIQGGVATAAACTTISNSSDQAIENLLQLAKSDFMLGSTESKHFITTVLQHVLNHTLSNATYGVFGNDNYLTMATCRDDKTIIQPIIGIGQFKSKLNLDIFIGSRLSKIPILASFKDGWITFTIDKNFIKNNLDQVIIEYINSLS